MQNIGSKSNNKHTISFNDSQYLSICDIPDNNIQNDNKHKRIETKKSSVKNDLTVRNEKNNDSNFSLTNNEQNCSLSSWDLPEAILEKYRDRGLKTMFPWQVECLSNPKLLVENKNLIYSAPTSAGKTLVAEILALKTILERRKKVLIILPFVSVVREKMFYFQDILSSSGIRVEGFMGSYNPPGGFKMVQLAICTIEKANSLINRLLEENTISDIGAVIIDEMHLVSDPSRGYILELLLTKLLYMSFKMEDFNIQLIGMSATLPNLDLLAKWLKAELYTTNFRPIPLYEYCMVNSEIYNNKLKLYKRLEPLPDLTEDTDNILQMCLETISSSCSVLIFCPTKNWCENLAQQISVAFWKLGNTKSHYGQLLREQLSCDAIAEILEQLKNCPVGLDTILKKTVSFGVAFHHAGLTMDERDIIEGAFRNGALRVLVATSTLSSGVNLPAQRVIIRTPLFHGKPIDSLTYRQMIGRAGRMGKDTLGESILICQKNDKKIAAALMSAELKPIESSLQGAGKLKRAILEAIASNVVTSVDDVNLFADCTLLATIESNFNKANDLIGKTIEFLEQNEFIRLQKNEMGELHFIPTALAKACLSSSLPPEDGLILFEELEKARRCFVLDTELHLLYLVTPYSVCYQWNNIDWMVYLNMWEKLSASNKRVADLVGVKESFIFNATRGKISTNSDKMHHRLQIHKRFYTALALHDLVNEIPLSEVAEKFQCSRGLLQSLQQSASTFAGMVTAFSRQLGWKCVEILISQFQDRLQFGIQHELLDLLKLPLLNGQRARTLYNADIKSLIDLANYDVCKLENILYSSVPFQSDKEYEGETKHDVDQKIKLKNIWITGKEGLTAKEAAIILIEDARKYLEHEMGAKVKWNTMHMKNEDNIKENNSYSQSISCENKTKSQSIHFENNKSEHKNNICDKIAKKYDLACDENKSISENCSIDKNKIFSCEQSERLIKNESCQFSNETKENKFINETFDRSSNIFYEITLGNNIEDVSENHNVELNLEQRENEINSKMASISISKDIKESFEHLSIDEEFINNLTKTDEHANGDINNLNPITSNDSNEKENNNNNASNNAISQYSGYNWSTFNNSITFNDPVNDANEKINEDLHITNISNITSGSDSLFEDSLCLDSKICKALDTSNENFGININDTNSPNFQTTNALNTNNIHFFEHTENILEDENSTCKDICEKSIPETKNFNNDVLPTMHTNEINNSYVYEKNYQNSFDMKLNNLFTNCNNENINGAMNDVIENSQSEFTDDSVSSRYSISKKKDKKHIKRHRNEDIDCNNSFSKFESPKKKKKTIQYKKNEIEIIDVTNNKRVFEIFSLEIKKIQSISLAIGCEYFVLNKPKIGQKIINTPKKVNDNKLPQFVYGSHNVCGMAFYWGVKIYYISLTETLFVSNSEKISLLKNIFKNSHLIIKIFNAKENIKILYKACKIKINCQFEDIKVADWLLNPEGTDKNLQNMVSAYVPNLEHYLHLMDNNSKTDSVGLTNDTSVSHRIRSSIEAVISWHVMEKQKQLLLNEHFNLLDTFDIEMKSIQCLIQLELNGLSVDTIKTNSLITMIQEQMTIIEKQGFELAGRKFQFSSSKDVARVLGIFKGKKVSTSKHTLEQIEDPIANLILQWRKLNSIKTKTLYPILQNILDNRIYSSCITRTATGRISMHEPNLQNIPRNFDLIYVDKTVVPLSIRSIFIPSAGNIFLSADYCQLELRLLAHLSQDLNLCNIMKSNEDIFKSIASQIYKIKTSEINDIMRQRAKQLCYGIIYGMGTKTLSDQLQTTEDEARHFMENFMSTYPAIKKYIQKVIDNCKEKGYVETLAKRKRYLPNIKHKHPAVKCQAERQAVNTTIQGSAADLAKKAMVLVDKELKKYLPSGNNENNSRAAFVLHIHDELLYEIESKDLKLSAKIIKRTMESVVELSIPFPVKLKYGRSWGEMKEFVGTN